MRLAEQRWRKRVVEKKKKKKQSFQNAEPDDLGLILICPRFVPTIVAFSH